jgi:hypothetical protein
MRHQKFFKDKFLISSEKIRSLSIINSMIFNHTRDTPITFKNVQSILSSLNLYLGVFYIKPSDANFNLLNLNLENVYQDTVKLNKQSHSDNDWAYTNDEFQKVYVLDFDGKNAIIALFYNDPFSPFIIDQIPTENIFLEGNIAKSILEEVYS